MVLSLAILEIVSVKEGPTLIWGMGLFKAIENGAVP